MATGQGFTNAREADIINAALRNTTWTAVATLFVGLWGAAKWLPTHAYALNSFVLPTANGNTRLFKATAVTGTGTSAGTEPTWPSTDAGTVVDNAGANQITWTEQTLAMDAQTDATTTFVSELSGSGYARLSIGTGNFSAPVATAGTTTGSTSSNASAITFAAATADWVPIGGFVLCKTGTTGYHFWARLSNQLQVNNTQQAQFNAAGLVVTVD